MLLMTESFDTLMAAKAISVTLAVPTGPLKGAKVKLAKASFVPSRTLAVGGITIANYTGYADGVPDFEGGVAYRDVNGSIALDSVLMVFQPSDAVTPNQIFGYILTDSAGTTCLGSELFPSPVSLPDALSAMAFLIQWFATNNSPGGAQLVS